MMGLTIVRVDLWSRPPMHAGSGSEHNEARTNPPVLASALLQLFQARRGDLNLAMSGKVISIPGISEQRFSIQNGPNGVRRPDDPGAALHGV